MCADTFIWCMAPRNIIAQVGAVCQEKNAKKMHKKSRPEMQMLWQNDNKKTWKLCKLTVDKCGFMRYNLTCKEQKK